MLTIWRAGSISWGLDLFWNYGILLFENHDYLSGNFVDQFNRYLSTSNTYWVSKKTSPLRSKGTQIFTNLSIRYKFAWKVKSCLDWNAVSCETTIYNFRNSFIQCCLRRIYQKNNEKSLARFGCRINKNFIFLAFFH